MTINWYGTSGNDTYDNPTSEDINAYGFEGNDYIWTGSGNDYIDGWTDNDTLKGYFGNDAIYGYSGDDYLYGEAGNDYLYGEADNDYINGGSGQDVLYGGAGADKFVFDGLYDGVDIIKDFEWKEGDKIQVSKFGFGATSITEFSYDYNNGNLFYNGNLFATVENKPSGFVASLDVVLV